jgi:hypothetical protein
MTALKAFFLLLMMSFFPLLGMKPLEPHEFALLKKVTIIEHVSYETYLNTDKGLASVMGYHFDWYFTDRFFGVLAIFGAVGGERGGYGIAAVGCGYRIPLSSRVAWDARLMVGSGGGGGLSAGGGAAIEGMAGFSYDITNSFGVELKAGYLAFPTGSFETQVINLGFSYRRETLYLPWNKSK